VLATDYTMGASSKRKKEKAKDFQKPKLKVGKARPKNTNATDTSFAVKCKKPVVRVLSSNLILHSNYLEAAKP